jgi:hypothetical protein
MKLEINMLVVGDYCRHMLNAKSLERTRSRRGNIVEVVES